VRTFALSPAFSRTESAQTQSIPPHIRFLGDVALLRFFPKIVAAKKVLF